MANAADEGAVQGASRKQKANRQTQVNDVAWVLSTPQGRRFIWRYLEDCKVFQTTFNPSGSIMTYQEGQRNVGLMLLADVNESQPEAYILMMNEARKQKENSE